MRRRLFAATTVALVGAATVLAGPDAGRHAAEAQDRPALTALQERLLSGVGSQALERGQDAPRTLQRAQTERTDDRGGACAARRGRSVRVNQECQNVADPDLLGRSQAQNEPAIAHDPGNPRRLVASSNDYRRGDGSCYAYASDDAGRTWQDSTAPMSFTRGTAFGGFARKYWQAGGDTSVAWDTKGNAYLSCYVFNRGTSVSQEQDAATAFYVFRSSAERGAAWTFPARPVIEVDDPAGTGPVFLDKQYMTVDDHPGSPYQDRVYVTWTTFATDGTALIYGAWSSDYAESFSAPVLISTSSPLCPEALGASTAQSTCTLNQFSQPFTGPDGTLYVVWDNFNATAPGGGTDNRAQVLLTRSTDGGATFSAPVKVADFYDFPDCAAYQGEPGAVSGTCIPETGPTTNSVFRATNYPSGAVHPRDPDRVVVSLGSYLSRHSNEANGCRPAGYEPEFALPRYEGVKVAGACNNDVVVSVSDDGGATFTGGTTDVRELPSARPDDPQAADQFFQWADFDRRGRFAVAFYDRHYGDDQRTGWSDVSLAGSRDASAFRAVRLTSSPTPPATQFSGGFFGDYIGLTAHDRAHAIWVDTRDPALTTCRDEAGAVRLPPAVCTTSAPNAPVANDQNLHTASLRVPTP